MPRPTPRRLVKSVCALCLAAFLFLNMHVMLRGFQEEDTPAAGDELPPRRGQGSQQRVSEPSLRGNHPLTPGDRNIQPPVILTNTSSRPPQPRANDNQSENRTQLPPAAVSLPAGNPLFADNPSRDALRALIRDVNQRQFVRNLDRFDLKSGRNSVVVVVQVHSRLEYLRHLVDSFRAARGIEQVLLVFSHDVWDVNINRLVAGIDYAPVMQIFYPYMMQAYPGEFPGEDPRDCPRNIKRQQALASGCNNANHPDKYGHYREARYVQTKHHWFWKINHVFDFLTVTRAHTGPVLFAEEDHYFAPDFVHVLQLMYKLRDTNCKDCSILTLGGYDKHPTYGDLSSKGLLARVRAMIGYTPAPTNERRVVMHVDVLGWMSNKHNMGMALTRTVWEQIRKCAQAFCLFDDYNWDWSLQYIGMTCFPARLKVMIAKSPRIFHIGECGVHHKAKGNRKCDAASKVDLIRSLLRNSAAHLFPSNVAVHSYPRTTNRVPKANGGWGDARDRKLCLDFLSADAHR